MTDIPALPIKKVTASTVSKDGQHALFEALTNDGHKITIAIPADGLMDLMSLVSSASGQAQKILQHDQNMKHVFPTEWWEIWPHNDQLVMSFRMPGGMELSFQMHRDAAARFRETLDVILGGAPNVQNTGPKH